jgi:hypothetical protein
MAMARKLVWCVYAAAFLHGASHAAAQVVRGVVVDDQNLSRVSSATVRLVIDDDLGAGAETDAEGGFTLALPGGGEYRLEVARIGYRTTRSQLFRVEDDDTVTVEFRVAPDAVLLAPLMVTARSGRGRDLFEGRRGLGKGVFLAPEDIEAMTLYHPADVFRHVDGVDMTWGWGKLPSGGRGPIPTVRSRSLRGCILYMVDRVWVRPAPWEEGDWSGWELAALLPEDIVAVETYRSVFEVPDELRRYTHQRRVHAGPGGFTTEDLIHCGLVVIWTQAGW